MKVSVKTKLGVKKFRRCGFLFEPTAITVDVDEAQIEEMKKSGMLVVSEESAPEKKPEPETKPEPKEKPKKSSKKKQKPKVILGSEDLKSKGK